MNIKNSFSLTKTDLITGCLTFVFIFMLTFGTRQYRLNSFNAILVKEKTNLVIDSRIDISELNILLDSLNIDFSPQELVWSAKLLGWKNIQLGNYELEGEYSYELFLSKLGKGIQDPVSVVVLPGVTKEKFAESISAQVNVSSEEILSILTDTLFLQDLNLSPEQLFGRMLPETYLMYWTSSPKDLVRRILREFDEKVTFHFNDTLKNKKLTINEILTMASIVEWEANIEDEKPIISGLYWNRLNKRMKLQADPTVNFALGERRRLLFEDYEFEHPFNTYLIKGLPPGPITNPSLSTIRATIFPVKHDYLYMVANPEGGHVFTKNFEQHQIESEKWRNWLRMQYRLKRQKEAEEALNK